MTENPYDNLYDAGFDEEGITDVRKVSKDDLPAGLRDIIEGQLDCGILMTMNWKEYRDSDGEKELRVTAIHVRKPRVRNPLAEQIVKDVTTDEMTLTIDIGDGELTYKIRKIE